MNFGIQAAKDKTCFWLCYEPTSRRFRDFSANIFGLKRAINKRMNIFKLRRVFYASLTFAALGPQRLKLTAYMARGVQCGHQIATATHCYTSSMIVICSNYIFSNLTSCCRHVRTVLYSDNEAKANTNDVTVWWNTPVHDWRVNQPHLNRTIDIR